MKSEIKKALAKAILYQIKETKDSNMPNYFKLYISKDMEEYIYANQQYLELLPDKDLMALALLVLLHGGK